MILAYETAKGKSRSLSPWKASEANRHLQKSGNIEENFKEMVQVKLQ